MKIKVEKGEETVEGVMTYPSQYSAVGKNVVRKRGDIVTVFFSANIQSSLAGQSATIATLPEGFTPHAGTPNQQIAIWGTYSNTPGFWDCSITSGGAIVTQIGSQSLTGTIKVQVTFIR